MNINDLNKKSPPSPEDVTKETDEFVKGIEDAMRATKKHSIYFGTEEGGDV